MKIGLDVMGGDFAPIATIEGAILALKELPATEQIVLIGPEQVIREQLGERNVATSVFEIVHAPEVIRMGEHATKAISRKPDSSISVGFNLLKHKKIDAITSAGNSGAMLVGSIFSVNTIQGVLRPCTSALIPQEDGSCSLLVDVGTNPDAKPDMLYQFGLIGSVYMQHLFNKKTPRVALLNIGSEEEKGNLCMQSAHKMMKDSKDFNFIGNIESRDLMRSKADVMVCDGFTGNVVLKLIESMYRTMQKRDLLDDFFSRLNYENYGGTPVLGINGTVIVGHGISNNVAIKNMILMSRDLVKAKVTGFIKHAFAHLNGVYTVE